MARPERASIVPSMPAEPYSRQPWKALYILHRLLSTLVLQPLWVILHFSPWSPFPRAWTLRETLMIRSLRRVAFILSRTDMKVLQRDLTVLPDNKTLKETRAIWIPPAGEEWLKGVGRSDEVATVRIPGYVWGKGRKDVGEMYVGHGESVCLFMHGGGLAVGSAHESDLTATIPRKILALTPISHVLSVDYRKVQSAPFPAALLDCLSAYVYLTTKCSVRPSQILFAGDSAGGHLVLALARYLRDGAFELPKALLLFSPWVDMSKDAAPQLYRFKHVNTDVDFLNVHALQPYISSRLIGTSSISLLDGPYLSPAASTLAASPTLFAGFPPAFVTSGSKEVLIEQIREVVKRLEMGGVNVVYDEQPDAVHDYEISDWFQPKMRERIWAKAAGWIGARFTK